MKIDKGFIFALITCTGIALFLFWCILAYADNEPDKAPIEKSWKRSNPYPEF
jgi:uncharacterized alpha/beta hydrolase family protein